MAVFVGRQRELTALRARLDATASGQPGVCLIAGEPGIGKTRLAAELAAVAENAAWDVRWGRCWEGPGAPALWPWTQALSTDEGLEWLPAGGEDRLEAADDRFVVYETVVARLGAESERRPLLVVLDDLHWADVLSLRVLQFVAQHLRDGAVLIVGTYRDAAATLDSEQRSILDSLSRHALAVPLRGLNRAEITELLGTHYGRTLTSDLARRLEEATAGNPFFIDEVMRLMDAEGSTPSLDVRRVPDGVREAIRRRLELLPPETAEVLRTASVLGRAFVPALLESVAGVGRAEMLARLEPAVETGLLRTDDRAFRFAHALVRETIYADLDATHRGPMHRRAAQALERFHSADLEDHTAELAYHFAQAGHAADARKAASYYHAAGTAALLRFAYEEAADHAAQGLRTLQATPDPDLQMRAELHLLEAEARLRLSDAAGLKAAATRAAADARAAGSNEHLARAAIAYGSMAQAWATDPEGIDLCESALDAVGATRPDLRARVLCSLAWMHVTKGDLDSADRPSERALELAREVGTYQTLCRALYVRQEVFYGTEKAAEQLALSDELTSIAEHNRDAYWQAQGHRCRALPRLTLGDVKGFATDAEATARLGATLRSRVHMSLGHSWQAVLALLEGRFDAVEAQTNQALTTLPGDPDALMAYASQLFWLRHEQGRLHEIRHVLAMGLEQQPRLPAARAAAAHLHAELGEVDDARRHLDVLLARGLHRINRDWGWSMTMTSIASALALLGERDQSTDEAAATLLDLLEPFQNQLVVVASVTHCPGAFDRYRGMLAAVLGRWDEAEAAYGEALRLEERGGAVPLAARTRYWLARMLADRRAEGDGERARDLLERCIDDARAMGMMRLGEQAEKLLACV